jgi:hypothetical protein
MKMRLTQIDGKRRTLGEFQRFVMRRAYKCGCHFDDYEHGPTQGWTGSDDQLTLF